MTQTDKKLHHLTIHEAGKLLKDGELSPVELTQRESVWWSYITKDS